MAKMKYDPKKQEAERKARERQTQLNHKSRQKNIAALLALLEATIKDATQPSNRAYHAGEVNDLGEARNRIFRISAGTSPQRRWR